MIGRLYDMVRPAIFTLDAEIAHQVSLQALQTGAASACGKVGRHERLRTELAGLEFENPVGLAAGYDKNGVVPGQCLRLGFGFVEVGTVTPRAQSGNPKPRIFRLIKSEGIINRLGFNNDGHDTALKNLKSVSRPSGSIIGVNIGANKDSDDFVADYVSGLKAFWEVADYYTANISSPNTPGLRGLQSREALQKLLQQLFEARESLMATACINRPVFLKIAPDIDEAQMDDIAEVVRQFPLDALIVSNTTLDRSTVAGEKHASEAGGLSGKPLFERSTIVLAKMRERLGSSAKIIGVGGVDSAKTAFEKITAGANLVQLYSAMVYHGPGLPRAIVNGLEQLCEAQNIDNISAMVGTRTAQWAAKTLE